VKLYLFVISMQSVILSRDMMNLSVIAWMSPPVYYGCILFGEKSNPFVLQCLISTIGCLVL
jgi:hypothetical protein